MARRRHAATAFRPSAPAMPDRAPSRRQTASMLAGVLAVAAGITVASFAVKPDKARSFDLFYGSIFVDDNVSPVAIDLSSGKATVRLSDASSAVSAESTQDLDMVPLAGGTLMLDPASGEFNMLDSSGFVIKPTGGGVLLPQLPGAEATTAVASGDSAYLVRSGGPGVGTTVYLVGQSTVASAVGTTTAPKARAAATLRKITPANPDVMTSANGQLWLLTGKPDGDNRQIVQLSVPAGSNAGAPLDVRRRTQTNGLAAVASATVRDDGTGGDAVAVASSDTIKIFTPDGTKHSISVDAPDGLTNIWPVRDAQGGFAFFYQGATTWTLVRAPIEGGTATSTPIEGIAASTDVLTPVESGGRIYTLARNEDGTLLQLGDDGTAKPIPGFEKYPILENERLDLRGAELTADGSRVIYDSRANLKAVVVFADGSHEPRTIDKHSAVQVDTNGAASITDRPDTGENKPTPGKQPDPRPRPEQAINNKIDCKTVSQTPHIPSIQLVARASRSVQLHWTYPLLDPQDCAPSTYTVTTKLLESDAPSPPSTVTIQGQDGVNLTGLFPDTRYRIVLTAYINKQHTSSQPLEVKTSVEGPAAPSGVRTTVERSGNWVVSWNSCGGVRSGCVPTADWQIIPHLCDGVGLSSTPDTRRRVGDPTQHAFSYTYQGSDSLLGRGLSFDVQGVGTKGTIGETSGDGSCSYSWAPPVAENIKIHASAPPITTDQSTSSTRVSVDFTNQVHDLGGVGGELTYLLLRGDQVVAREGPTTKTSMTLPGIEAGRSYQAAVVVNPPRHRNVTERVGPIDVKAAIARWPQPMITTNFVPTSAYHGSLRVTMTLPPGTRTHGETFDLTGGSNLRCSNASTTLSRNNISSGSVMSFDIDRTRYNSLGGSCRVAMALLQNDGTVTDPPLYGDGTTSSTASAPVTIDPPSLTVHEEDFSASWNSDSPPGQPQIVVRYAGGDALFLLHANNWDFRVSNDGGTTSCGRSTHDLSYTNPTVTIDVDRDCIKTGGAFTVAISFRFYGRNHDYIARVAGSAPTPVDSTKISFTAEFIDPPLGIGNSKVRIHYNGPYDQSTLNSLNWSYYLESDQSPGINCLQANSSPTPNSGGNGPDFAVNFTRCPSTVDVGGTPTKAVYTVDIHFRDPNYGVTGDYSARVEGEPK